MYDHPYAWSSTTPRDHVFWQEALMDAAPASPQENPGAPDAIDSMAPQAMVGIPQEHIVPWNAQTFGGVAPQMLVRKEKDSRSARQCPSDGILCVRRGAHQPSMLPAEGLQVSRGIHIGYGHDIALDIQHLTELRPRVLHLVPPGHLGHWAAGLYGGQKDGLAGLRQDGGGFGHKVHAAEHDGLCLAATGGITSQLERVAAKVGELDHLVPLVMVAQDDEG
jgi:hypothetical protein